MHPWAPSHGRGGATARAGSLPFRADGGNGIQTPRQPQAPGAAVPLARHNTIGETTVATAVRGSWDPTIARPRSLTINWPA